jgi:aminopeptidase N
MKNIKILLLAALSLFVVNTHAQMLSKGVSKELADHRKANISNVVYDLTFYIPSDLNKRVTGKAFISFELKTLEDVVLDFQGGFDGTCYTFTGKKNKRKAAVAAYQNEHIIIPARALQLGKNKVELDFVALDKALNRNNDYMYTVFEPDMARSAFPCFCQPDLRAVFVTTLSAPSGWKAMASDNSCQLPIYLYSFVAGNFEEKTDVRNGRTMRALYLESDPAKISQLDKVFDEAAQAVKWMEGYTSIACPFKEYGMVILPNYPYGGMEHPGAIQYDAHQIFLEKYATQEDELARMELIAHETAHLWFGGLVSLKWFDDLWANEVLACFMSSKITRRQYSQVDHDLNFIKSFQTRAIYTDRTEGTHPIAQELTNVNHASLLYDNILYDKAPVMMRMMEQMMGAPSLQNGLHKYLVQHQFDNATWDDLITTLDKESPSAGIRQFSDIWVKQKGLPTINTSYKNGQLVITQSDPFNRGVFWPQKFQIRAIYDLSKSRTIVVDMQKPTMTFKLPSKPDYIIPNADGMGYGRFTLDDEFTTSMPKRLITTRNDLNRYALLLAIHDNYLMGKIPPSHFGELFRMMVKEKNTLIMSTAIDHMFKIVRDVKEDQRAALELCVMDLLGENRTDACHQYIIRKMSTCASSPEVLAQIEKIWRQHNDPLLNEYDYMEMAYRLAIMNPKRWEEILATQKTRLRNEDMKKEFDFVSRACNPDANERTRVFNSLLRPENRQQEPWAFHTLQLLNSDVFEPQSNSYIEPSLMSLEYFQQTSDVFFVEKWMTALMADHKSKEAAQIIERYLKNNPTYPENLRNKVLEASWILMKQVPYVEPVKPQPAPAKKSTTAKKTTKKATTPAKKTTTKKK